MGNQESKAMKKTNKYKKLGAPLLKENQPSQVLDSSKSQFSSHTEEMFQQNAYSTPHQQIMMPKKKQQDKVYELRQKEYKQVQVQKQGDGDGGWQQCVGLVISKFQKKTQICTGTWVSRNAILTCARNVYSRQTDSQPQTINFSMKVGGKTRMYKCHCVYFPPQYKVQTQQKCCRHDYAILQFQNKSKKGKKFIEFGNDKQIDFYQKQVQIYGYDSEQQGKMHYNISSQALQYQNNRLYYLLQNNFGQLGNPLYIKNQKRIVGIQCQTQQQFQMPSAIYFSKEERKKICQELQSIKHKYGFIDKMQNNGGNTGVKSINGQGMQWSQIKSLTKHKQAQVAILNLDQTYIHNYILSQLSMYSNLTQLSLWANNLTSEDIKFLTASKFNHLLKLNLGFNSIGDEGMVYVRKLQTLRELSLQNNHITALGVKELANCNSVLAKNISILRLWDNQIGDKGLQYLKTFQNLTQLYLFKNQIGNEGAKKLAKARLKKLTILDLMYNKIGQSGAKQLSKLKNITQLYLCKNRIGTDGLIQLTQNKQSYVTVLDIGENNIDDSGIKLLQRFSKLTKLYLSNNQITKQGLVSLMQTTQKLRFISEISIRNNKFTISQGQQFRRRLKLNRQIQIKL